MTKIAQTLDLLFDKLPIGLAQFTAEQTLVRANPTWRQYLHQYAQVPMDEITPGASLRALLAHPQAGLGWPMWQKWLTAVLSGQTLDLPNVTWPSIGQTCCWHIEFLPTHNETNGRVDGFLLVIHDETPQKQAEQELEAMQNALLTLMSNLPGMSYRGQPNEARVMELVNATAVELTGYPAHAFLKNGNTPYASLIHPDDWPLVREALDTAVADKQPFEIVYRIYTKEQRIKWVLERGGPVLSATQQLLALEGFIMDITERVLARQLLERRVADRTHKLATMHQVTKVAAEQLTLTAIFDEILPHVSTAVQATASAILLLDRTAPLFHLTAVDNLPPALDHTWQTPIPSNPLFERILAEATAYSTPNLQRDSAANLAPTAVRQTGWHALAGIRIVANQRPIGLMLCLRADQRPFSETDLALLESVADQLGTTAVNDSLRQENNRLLVLEERHRLARELHDAVTHSLYSLTLFAETTNRFAAAGDLEQVQHYTSRMKTSALQSLREMRLLLHNLRPPSLSKLGLTGAIQHRLDAVEQRAGMAYTFFTDGDLEALPTAVEDALWHVTEEALNNALKHSGATAIDIRLVQQAQTITLTISDNGQGYDPDTAVHTSGQGLGNMRERLHLLRGTLQLIPHQPHGLTVTATVNLRDLPHQPRTAALPNNIPNDLER